MEMDIRPWGKYEVLLDTPSYKVKRITVKPKGSLSYQYHKRRSEVWVIVSGNATYVVGDVEKEAFVGDIITIPVCALHRVTNTGTEPLEFIEVQTGTYFGEDDIVRIDDIYGRTE